MPVPPIPWPGIVFHRLQFKNTSSESRIGPLSPNLGRELHILQLVLFLLQRKDLIGYLAEVRNEIFNITLGLGYFLGLMILASGATAMAVDEDAFVEAACSGHSDIVKLFLDKGMNVDVKNPNGITALMCASAYGRPETVELLLSRGANANATDETGETALLKASCKGHTDVVNLLVEKGVDAELAQKQGVTPLMCSSFHGHSNVVEPSLRKERKLTPLMEPVRRRCLRPHAKVTLMS